MQNLVHFNATTESIRLTQIVGQKSFRSGTEGFALLISTLLIPHPTTRALPSEVRFIPEKAHWIKIEVGTLAVLGTGADTLVLVGRQKPW